MRWKTVVPLALPHMMTADTVVTNTKDGQQVLLPQGAWVLPNLYAMDQDPLRFARPGMFDPQRHLQRDEGEHLQLKPDDTVAFGSGKRRCVGEAFASISVQVVVAHMIWLFDVQRKGCDESELNANIYGSQSTSCVRF